MKILFLTQWYPPEPLKILGELSETLQARGHEVTVVTAFPNYPSGNIYPGYRLRLFQKEVINGVNVIRVPLYPDHSGSAIKRVLNYVSFALSAATLAPLLVRSIDVIHVYLPPYTMAWPAWVMSRLRRVPITYEVQDLWPESLSATGMVHSSTILNIVDRCVDRVYKTASAIRVISPGFRDTLIGRGVPAEKIHVISNWVDTSFYKPEAVDPQLAADLGLAGRFNIMFAGNMGMAQGLESVIAAARLLQDVPEIQIVMVGDGGEYQKLRDLAADVSNIKFLGRYPAEAMGGLYALADVLLIHLRADPVFRITIPHKTFSYLSSGKPILAAVEGDVADLVTGVGAGMSCAPENPEALAAAIREFYALQADKRAEMGSNGRQAVIDSYSREHLIGEIITMMESVAKKRGRKRVQAQQAVGSDAERS